MALASLTEMGGIALSKELREPFTEQESEQLCDVQQIVHCAALSSPWAPYQAFYDANVRVTQNTVRLAESIGVQRFVFISTPSVYFRFEDQRLVSEDSSLPKPVNAYARTKALAETIVEQSTLSQKVILRPRGIYGAGDQALLPRLMRAASAGPLPLFRSGVAATDLTHVNDVVQAVIAALETSGLPDATLCNISGGNALNVKHVIERACAMKGITPRWKSVPFALALQLTRASEIVHKCLPARPEPKVTAYSLGLLAFTQTLSIARASKLLNWQPQISFEEGLSLVFPEGRRQV